MEPSRPVSSVSSVIVPTSKKSSIISLTPVKKEDASNEKSANPQIDDKPVNLSQITDMIKNK